MSETTEDVRLCMHGNGNRAMCLLCILEDFQMRTPAEFAFALAAARREVETVTKERDRLKRLFDHWSDTFGDVAKVLGCLSSHFPDGNEHVLRAANRITSDLATSRAALSAAGLTLEGA